TVSYSLARLRELLDDPLFVRGADGMRRERARGGDTGPVSAWFGAGPAVRVKVASSGLIAAGARSSAILSVDGGRAKTYGVGDALANDLVLDAVRGDGVVIRQGGQTSFIEVPRLPPPTGITTVGSTR
ncbi:hypothetical protein IMZ29_17445, partial [Achromobacter sp. GG226]|uniref:type II secretion system protein N n=1 Tax=Verticiella alkaliphila TaxID=2779529 RepID=UPI001C0DD92B